MQYFPPSSQQLPVVILLPVQCIESNIIPETICQPNTIQLCSSTNVKLAVKYFSPKKHSRHHHHAKIPSLQDLESRRRRGSEVVLGLSERSNTTLGIAESELDKEQSSLTSRCISLCLHSV